MTTSTLSREQIEAIEKSGETNGTPAFKWRVMYAVSNSMWEECVKAVGQTPLPTLDAQKRIEELEGVLAKIEAETSKANRDFHGNAYAALMAGDLAAMALNTPKENGE